MGSRSRQERLSAEKRLLLYVIVLFAIALLIWIPLTTGIAFLFADDAKTLTWVETLEGCLTLTLMAIILYFISRQHLLKIRLSGQKARESKLRYQSLVENNPDGIYSFDHAGTILKTNPAFETIFGYGKEELIGTNCLDLVIDQDRDRVASMFAWSNIGKSQQAEIRAFHKDGHIIDIRIKTVPIVVSGEIVGFYGITQDITRKKRAEEELRNARQELADTVREQQGMTFKFKKINGKFIHTLCDGELVYRLGLHPDQVVGKELGDFLPAGTAAFKNEIFERIWQGEENVIYENELNGVTYLASIRPIKRDGTVVEGIASCVDITDRKIAEEELRATKEKLESFINHTSDGIVLLDLQGNVLQVNNGWEKIFGWSVEEVVGAKLPTVLEEDIPVMLRLHEEVLSGTSVSGIEARALRKDGEQIDISSTISPIRDANGRVIAFAGIVRDITEKKRIEQALRESEAKYRLIAENMSDLIGIMDGNGIVKYVSPSVKTVLGISPEEFLGDPAAPWVHPEDHPRCEEMFAKIHSVKKPVSYQFRHKHKDGHWIAIDAYMIPVLSADGEIESIVTVGRDVTEMKKTEELLQKSDKLSLVGQLAAGVAHEIRNPLTSLRGFVQLLQSRTNDYPQYFSVMLSELDRINFIVNEFLYLAKPQAVKFEHRDLCLMILEVISLLEGQAILANVRIKTDIASGIPYLNCEEKQLKQVFINILKNAIESMPDGGEIAVCVSQKDPRYVQIRFEDQGAGIPPERIPKLGEPFYTTKERGTGLGLMVSYKIIQEHRGHIEITSEVNKGTTVEINLPV